MNALVRSFLWLSGSNAVSLLLGIVVSGLLARILAPGEMGIFGLITAVASLVATVVLGWLQAPLQRFGKEALERTGRLQAVWRLRLPLLTAAAIVALPVLLPPAAQVWAEAIGIPWSWTLSVVIGMGVATLWFQAEVSTVFTITERFDLLGSRIVCIRLLWAVALTVIWTSNGSLSPVAIIAISWSITAIVTLVMWLWMTVARVPEKPVANTEFQVTTGDMAKHGAPVIVATLVGYLSAYGDHWLINHTLTMADVGQYQVAYQPFLIIVGVPGVLSQIWLPRIIREAAANKLDVKRDIQCRFPVMLTVWLMVLLSISAIVPGLYIAVFSERYAAGVPVLIILLAGAVFSSLTYGYTSYFNLQSRLGHSAFYHAIMTSCNLAISWFLLRRIGIIGAAIGTMASFWIGGALYAWDQQRYYAVRDRGQFILASVAAVVLLGNLAFLDQILMRLILALSGTVMVVWIARRHRYFDSVDFTALPWLSNGLRLRLEAILVSTTGDTP